MHCDPFWFAAIEAVMRVTYRLAGRGDASVVQSISAESYVPAYLPVIGVAPKPAYEDYSGWIEEGEVWLADIDGKLSGVLVLERCPDHLFIYSVAVIPRCQRLGLGKALLRLADERAAAAALPEIRLYTNRRMDRNVRLYHRCGYVDVGERPHVSRPGEVLVDMVKYLPPVVGE